MTFSCEKVGLEFFETAPTIHRANVEVAATPDQIFDAFLDAEAWTKWAMPITRVDWTSGFPLEVGSTRNVHMRGDLIGYEEFIAYEHGVRMAFRFNEMSKDSLAAFAEDYQVTDLGGGRCRVEWTMALKPKTGKPGGDEATEKSGAKAKVGDKMMGFMVRRMLKKFGKLVEADFTTAGAAK
ncbi:MAG: SRPBCC family protein [Acidimicrobiales bacterium]